MIGTAENQTPQGLLSENQGGLLYKCGVTSESKGSRQGNGAQAREGPSRRTDSGEGGQGRPFILLAHCFPTNSKYTAFILQKLWVPEWGTVESVFRLNFL